MIKKEKSIFFALALISAYMIIHTMYLLCYDYGLCGEDLLTPVSFINGICSTSYHYGLTLRGWDNHHIQHQLWPWKHAQTHCPHLIFSISDSNMTQKLLLEKKNKENSIVFICLVPVVPKYKRQVEICTSLLMPAAVQNVLFFLCLWVNIFQIEKNICMHSINHHLL